MPKTLNYFSVDPDKRNIKGRFDFGVYNLFGNIFTAEELGRKLAN